MAYSWLGISSTANLIAAVKLAKYFEFDENDFVFTIFTDSSDMYQSRLVEMNRDWGNYSEVQARIDHEICLNHESVDYLKELSYVDKKQIHNLKYFTWVEQQGKEVDELNAQWYDQNYWNERFSVVPEWNQLIEDFNKKTGLAGIYK